MIAITGAGGFIGATLAHRLAGEGHDLILVDRGLSATKAAQLAGLTRFRFLGHEAFLDALADGHLRPDAVFHLGACSRTTETDWAFLQRVNVRYTQSLWQWCANARVPLVYASSAATYGDGSRGFRDTLAPDVLEPLNLYGKSKNDFDRWALAQVRAGEIAPPTWHGVKFFNVYGPRETFKGRMASVVWQAYRQVREFGVVKLFRSTEPGVANGGQRRDFVYVEDCVDHLLHLQRSAAPSGLVNSGTGQARTFFDLASSAFAALGRAAAIEFIDMPADLAGKYQSFTEADVTTLRASGWTRAATSLEDGVRATVMGYAERAAA